MIAGLLLLGAASGISSWMLRRDPRIPAMEYLVLRFSLGLACIALVGLGAGLLGAFHPVLYWAVIIPGNLMLWLSRRDFSIPNGRFRLRPAMIVLGIFFAANLFYTLFPPTFHDSMVYHLAVPAHYIRHGGMVPWPTNFNAGLPLPVEMIYTILLLGGGLAAVRPLIWITTLGLAVLLFSAAAGLPGRRRWLPLLLFFTIPQVGFLACSSKTDIPGLLFLMTGITLLRHYMKHPGHKRFLIPAAFALGSAVAAKYTALFLVIPALVAAWFMEPRIRRRVGDWFLAGLAGALCLVPWWGRNLVFTGNPLYPYLNGIFKAPGWSPAQAADFSAVIKRRQDNHLRHILTFPVKIFLKPYHYGMTAVMGILFLVFLPGLFHRPRNRDERLLWYAGLSGFIILLFFARAPRYFLPALFLLSIPAARGILQIPERFKRRKLPLVLGLGLCLLTNLVLQISLQERYFLGVTHLSRRLKGAAVLRYLDMLPYHRAARFAERALPEKRKVAFLGEDRSFYFPGDKLVSSTHDVNPVLAELRRRHSKREMRRRLVRQGITHILYCPAGLKIMSGKSVTYHLSDKEIIRLESFLASLPELYRDQRYRLLALPPPANGSFHTEKPKIRSAG